MKMQVRRRQIETLLRLQDEMNTQVHPQWIEQGFPWYRAAWTECAELMDHWGWKWWKKQEPDMEQVHLELVDILHFCLSYELQDERDDPTRMVLGLMHFSFSDVSSDEITFLEELELFTEETMSQKAVNAYGFFPLAYKAGMTFEDLYTGYIGKNVLNRFRQDNGYKDGTYQKTWDGYEDNEHLAELVGLMETGNPEFPENLYRALEDRYRKLTGIKAIA